MELKFVVTCNKNIQAVILNCDNKEDALNRYIVRRELDTKDVKNIFANEYEPYFLGFTIENEDYSLDAFYFQIL